MKESDIKIKGSNNIYNFLDSKLYIDDGKRALEEVTEDAHRYSKYNFLTNGGESFDDFKSFAVRNGTNILFLYKDGNEHFFSGEAPITTISEVIKEFQNWIKNEADSQPACSADS